MVWSLSSYVIGRYSDLAKNGQDLHAESSLQAAYCNSFCSLFDAWGNALSYLAVQQDPVQASFRSFLFLLGSLAVLSPLLLLLLRRLFELKDLDNSSWSYIGSEEGFQKLGDMLKWSRVQVHLEHVLPSQINQSFSSQFVVDYFYGHSPELLSTLCHFQRQGAVVISRLSWCELVLQRFPPELLTESDLLDGCFYILSRTLENRVKRVGDIVVAACLLIVTSPLILASALLIKCSDRGPVFYSQLRTGIDGVSFRIWKLRTMRTNAEQQGAQWSSSRPSHH